MILRDLGTWVGDSAVLPSGSTEQDFMREAYHVREGFLVYLTRRLHRSQFLPDAAKINVYFGPDKSDVEYSCCLGIASIWLKEFDFHSYFGASEKRREEILLQALAAAVREVAYRQGVSREMVDSAEDDARSSGLYVQYAVKSLGRLHPNRKLRFDVVRSIQRGSESWFLQVSDRAGAVLETIPIEQETFGVIAQAKYRKSKWRNETFLLTDNRNRVQFRKSTRSIVARHIQ